MSELVQITDEEGTKEIHLIGIDQITLCGIDLDVSRMKAERLDPDVGTINIKINCRQCNEVIDACERRLLAVKRVLPKHRHQRKHYYQQ